MDEIVSGADTTDVFQRRTRPSAPKSVSEQAQRMLSMPAFLEVPPYPALDDPDAWIAMIAAMDAGMRAYHEALLPPSESFAITEERVGEITNYVYRPIGAEAEVDPPIFIEIHGGGLVGGGGDIAWTSSALHAAGRAGLTWAPDYRMPPLHPFPAALDDLVGVYRKALAERPSSQIVVSGASAGGNLAAALLLRVKELGLPMPAALVLLTPEVDLTESGDTFVLNDGIDMGLTPLMSINRLYAGGVDLAQPHVSPLFGDLEGFPPTLLQSGTRDLFLSNTVRMHRALLRAGVEAELHVFEAMPHGSFGGTAPEDYELRAEVRRFEAAHLRNAAVAE